VFFVVVLIGNWDRSTLDGRAGGVFLWAGVQRRKMVSSAFGLLLFCSVCLASGEKGMGVYDSFIFFCGFFMMMTKDLNTL
jgi:hypothetical protein